MQKYTLSLLSAIIGVSAALVPLQSAQAHSGSFNVAYVQQVAYVPSKGKVVNYRGTRLRYYPNHVIVADYYNERVIRNIVALSKELGWDTVYLQVPNRLRVYTNQYFINNDLDLNYFSVNVNPDDTIGLFYGAGGFGYSYGNRYYGNHHYRYHDGRHHDRRHDRRHGGYNHQGVVRTQENRGVRNGEHRAVGVEHRVAGEHRVNRGLERGVNRATEHRGAGEHRINRGAEHHAGGGARHGEGGEHRGGGHGDGHR